MAESAGSVDYSDMYFALHNGITLPSVGFGTFRLSNYDILYKTINYALEAGYRLFDTAAIYGNEKHLKRIFQKLLPLHELEREDIFITTKMSPFSSRGKSLTSKFERSLDNLGLDYIDMYLIHFPGSPSSDKNSPKHAIMRRESWLALAKIYDEAKVNAIGVANFTVKHLMELSEVMAIGPMINQVEWHPYYNQPEMIQYCCDHNIKIQAYSSFGGLSRGNRDLLEDPVVNDIALKYDVTCARVLLVWALQKGIAVIPKSTNPYHIKENRDLRFTLQEEDIKALDELSVKNQKFAWDPTLVA